MFDRYAWGTTWHPHTRDPKGRKPSTASTRCANGESRHQSETCSQVMTQGSEMGYILLIRGRRRNALGRMVKFEEQPESALGLKQWAMGHSITLPDEIPVSLIESKPAQTPVNVGTNLLSSILKGACTFYSPTSNNPNIIKNPDTYSGANLGAVKPFLPNHLPLTIRLKYTQGKKSFLRW